MLVLKGLVGFIEPFNFSFFIITGWGINLDYCDIDWFALEMNRDHSVFFEIASKYCVSALHSSTLAWRISWMEEPGGL